MPSEEEQTVNNEETLDNEKIVNLLNEAAASSQETIRISNLKQVQDLILRKNPTLLDNFLDEILQFQLDKSSNVKKFVVNFIEEACKQDNEVIFQLIDNFRYLLYDDNVNVQKRSYYAMINIFKNTLKFIAKTSTSLDESKIQTWLSLNDLTNHVAALLDSDNDGVRTSAIKFIEMLIIVLSSRSKESIVPSINENDISMEQINDDHELLDKDSMIEEGRHHMRKLIEYTLSNHISSVNLIASISVLSNISKQRPEFMKIVIDTLSTLLTNMPPTLGKSQVNTARKQMKLQLLSICKTPHAIEFQSQITSILSDLGLSSNEIAKAFPKISSSEANQRKRNLLNQDLNANLSSKRKIIATNPKQKEEPPKKKETPGLPTLDSVVDDLTQKLNVQENVADLVMVSMAYLPDQMPAKFQSSYKPISAAGTTNQIKNLARMLAIQLNEAGLINFNDNSASKMIITIDDLDNDDDLENEENEFNIDNRVSIKAEKMDILERAENIENKTMTKLQRGISVLNPSKPRPDLETLMSKKSNIKTFKLSEVTANASTEFNLQTVEELLKKTYNRILNSEETVARNQEASLVRKKVIVETTSLPNYENHLTNYIFEDVRRRIDLGLMWIFNNYLNLKTAQQKLSIKSDAMDEDEIVEVQDEKVEEEQSLKLIKKYESDYDRTLYSILFNLQQRQDPRDFLFSKIICQVPLLTENCLKLLKSFCQDERRFYFSMSTLRDLIVTRYAQRQVLLNLLLEFTHNKNSAIRENAITICLKLHEREEFRNVIEKFALERLKFLVSPTMPSNLQIDSADNGNNQWTEEAIKTCLYLYLDLMPVNHSLIHPLSQIYIGSIPEVKRVILKMLEAPIKSMGMQSTELLKLIEDFSKGSETFVLRIIHILTENSIPSPKLVERVRELYNKRLPDVRFLIPILTGLTQKEIINALPQLIKLSQAVFKEVFNRLLGINVDTTIHKSPITPAELLIALHQIEPSACDLKTVIQATSLCFSEKKVYTEETLATVMSQLIDVTPIPTLYMRTVIQSVTIYPKLTGFVLIMMQRLIGKQIWKYPKVWEGFIKCCQRIKPISAQLLLQLPAAQLKEVFTAAPDLKEHLCKHISELDSQQKAGISEQLMNIIAEPAQI